MLEIFARCKHHRLGLNLRVCSTSCHQSPVHQSHQSPVYQRVCAADFNFHVWSFFLQVILRSACLSEDVFHVPWTCHLVFGEEFQVRMWPRWEQTRTSVSKQCSLLHHHWLQLASCVQFPLVTFSGRIPNINVMIHHGLVWGLGFGNHFTVATSKL